MPYIDSGLTDDPAAPSRDMLRAGQPQPSSTNSSSLKTLAEVSIAAGSQ